MSLHSHDNKSSLTILAGLVKIQIQQQRDRHRLSLHTETNSDSHRHAVTGSIVETLFFLAAAVFQVRKSPLNFLSSYSYLRDLVEDALAFKSDEVLRTRVEITIP